MYEHQQKGSVCAKGIVLSVSANCKLIATDSSRRGSRKEINAALILAALWKGSICTGNRKAVPTPTAL